MPIIETASASTSILSAIFFDGFLEYLDQEMQATIPDYDDAHFFDLLPEYDNAENLWDWYNMLETDPLPISEKMENEEDEAG